MKKSEKQLARALIDSLDGATKTQVESVATELVGLLGFRGETHRMRHVIEAIEDVWREKYGAAMVTIETAHEISGTLRKKLEALAPGTELKERVRPEMIGGAKLRIDDKIIDGSIEGHLAALKKALC